MIKPFLYRTFLPLATAAIFYLAASAQLPGYQLSILQEQEGLKTSDVINIAKDKDGFLWLASQGHVQRFDGRHTLQFTFRETVNKLIVDAQNRKWVVTRQGVHLFVNSYRGFKQIFVDPAEENASANLYEINGKIYTVSASGYYKYDDKKETFQPQAAIIENNKARPNRYIGKQGDILFFGTRDSILSYNLQTKQIAIARVGFIYTVVPLNTDELLVSTRRFETFYVNMKTGLVQLLGTEQNKKSPIGNNLIVYSGAVLQNGRYLLCSNKGLFEYDCRGCIMKQPVFYHNGRPLENQQSITAFYKDNDGTVYMNHADGIFFMKNSSLIQYFRNYRSGEIRMPDNDVRNFAEDEKGNIWMATTNGISRLNMQSGELKVFEPLSKTNSIDFPSYRQLLNDGNYLWIGTSGDGVWRYDKRTGKYERPVFPNTEEGKKQEDLFNVSYIWEILKLKDNKLLIVGGVRSFIIDAGSFQASQIFFTSSSFNSRSALLDSSGRIWHGTVRGLSCMDNSFKDLFFVRDSFPDKRVASFCEWKKDKMLIGSKGLFEIELQGNKILSFKPKKAIPTERLIYCMRQDRQGYVWMGTDDGLYRYDPVKDESILFDQSDYVQSQAFNSDASFLSSTGLLFMGGKNGVNYFNPASFSSSPEQLHPMIASFVMNADDSTFFTVSSSYKLPYNSRNLDFIMSAPEFKKPFRIQYRYRLNDGKNGWVNTGFNNRVRISKLQPGKYKLQVSASYDGKTWFDSKSSVSFANNRIPLSLFPRSGFFDLESDPIPKKKKRSYRNEKSDRILYTCRFRIFFYRRDPLGYSKKLYLPFGV
jgi:ligand-binding sensor domain-containing protein